MNRTKNLHALSAVTEPWEFLVIGGGATGLGTALDAASRGYRTLLLEQHDFAKGTSSRSTKLIHGGLRYLKRGNIRLVMASLRERGRLCRNAPHIVHPISFIVPIYRWWEGPYYGLAMKLYDRMAGDLGLTSSRSLSLEETRQQLPTLEPGGLRRGVMYSDSQFDDARLAVSLARTIDDAGGCALNYMRVVGLIKERGRIAGVQAIDDESGREYEIRARVVVNATGVFTDRVRKLDESGVAPVMTPSQGSHIVLPREFLPGDSAIMIPRTADGRVLFAVPWHDHVVVGTTDVGLTDIPLEPRPGEDELAFLLDHAARYLTNKPKSSDVLSVYSGLRPLVGGGAASGGTASLSRDHTLMMSPSGLVTVTGGKWTTYRKMAEDAVDQAQRVAGLGARPCATAALPIHGRTEEGAFAMPHLQVHGRDATDLLELADTMDAGRERLHSALPYIRAEVVWAVRHEMARTVEDVLARRTRVLVLNARAAIDMAPAVAKLMGAELGWDEEQQSQQVRRFVDMAQGYLMAKQPIEGGGDSSTPSRRFAP